MTERTRELPVKGTGASNSGEEHPVGYNNGCKAEENVLARDDVAIKTDTLAVESLPVYTNGLTPKSSYPFPSNTDLVGDTICLVPADVLAHPVDVGNLGLISVSAPTADSARQPTSASVAPHNGNFKKKVALVENALALGRGANPGVQRSTSNARSFNSVGKAVMGFRNSKGKTKSGIINPMDEIDLRTIDTTLIYEVLKPFFWTMKIFGILFRPTARRGAISTGQSHSSVQTRDTASAVRIGRDLRARFELDPIVDSFPRWYNRRRPTLPLIHVHVDCDVVRGSDQGCICKRTLAQENWTTGISIYYTVVLTYI